MARHVCLHSPKSAQHDHLTLTLGDDVECDIDVDLLVGIPSYGQANDSSQPSLLPPSKRGLRHRSYPTRQSSKHDSASS